MKIKLSLFAISLFLTACATPSVGGASYFAEFGAKYHVICPSYDGVVFWKDANVLIEDKTGFQIKLPDTCVWIKLDAK